MSFTRKSLGIELSRLKVFEKPKITLEQYTTESDIASDILWSAAMKEEIQGKIVADLGAGTGILGLGCMLLGAKKVYFVDIDKDALKICEENYQKLKEKYDLSSASAEFVLSDIQNFKKDSKEINLVVQNPPFGVKNAHADKAFLEKSFEVSPLIYSLHKSESKDFVEKLSKDSGFKVLEIKRFNFLLKQTMHYHAKRIQRVDVSCFKIGKM